MKKSKFIEFVENSNIQILTFLPPGAALALIIIWAFTSSKLLNNEVPQMAHYFVVMLGCFIGGISGLFQVLKREAPGPMGKSIKGRLAIASGVSIIFLFWGIGLAELYFIVSEYLISR